MLADTITPFALSALKYGLFVLLFLFIWRSMRWVVRGLSVAEAPRPRSPPDPRPCSSKVNRTRSRGR